MPALSRSYHSVSLNTEIRGLLPGSALAALKSGTARRMGAPRLVPVRIQSWAFNLVAGRSARNSRSARPAVTVLLPALIKIALLNMSPLLTLYSQTRIQQIPCSPDIRAAAGQNHCAVPRASQIDPVRERRWTAQRARW